MSTSNFLPLHMPHCDDSKMSLLPDENSMPEDFAGKPDAAISPFYKALSRTLGGPTSSPGAKAIKVKDLIKGRFARTKMGQMYALTTTQFDTVLIEVKAHVCWRPLIEEVGGGNFRVPQCPSSARLVEISSQAADTGRGAVKVLKENTLTDEIGRSQVLKVWVPKHLFKSVYIMDTIHTALDSTQSGLLSTEWALWAFSKYGKLNFGIFFVRHCARQFEHVYPKGFVRPGVLKWERILADKAICMNRNDASVRCCSPSPAHSNPCTAMPPSPAHRGTLYLGQRATETPQHQRPSPPRERRVDGTSRVGKAGCERRAGYGVANDPGTTHTAHSTPARRPPTPGPLPLPPSPSTCMRPLLLNQP